MQVDKTAVEFITDQAITAYTNVNADVSALNAVFAPKDLVLHNLEQYSEQRNRFRGDYTTSSIADFCSYSNLQSETKIFVDLECHEDLKAKAFFNLGDTTCPGHADHTATLKLKPTAAFKAAQKAAYLPLSQQQFAEFLEDWESQIIVTHHADYLPLGNALAAVRNVTITAKAQATHKEHDFGRQRSAMDEIEASSQDKLPTALCFNLVPYEGLPEIDLVLRVSVLTDNEKPTFRLRWMQEEAQREQIGQELKATLKNILNEGSTLLIGNFKA